MERFFLRLDDVIPHNLLAKARHLLSRRCAFNVILQFRILNENKMT